MKRIFFALAGCILSFTATSAQELLKAGTPAPPLFIQKWVKGTPVSKFEKGQVYIVEFTGTGCPPCRRAMPHLTRISRQYGNKVKVVSIFDGLENTGVPNYMNIFNALFDEFGHNMDYTIGIDKPDFATVSQWKIQGAPQVYIVDGDGKIAWAGRPWELDPIVESLAAGNMQKGIDEVNAYVNWVYPFYEQLDSMKANGHYLQAIARVDSLIDALTPVNHFGLHFAYLHKFQLLAGEDDMKAYDLVKWMLADENREHMKEFDWDHFTGDVDGRPSYKDYAMQLAVRDRCIELAEYKYVAGYQTVFQARTYLDWSKHRARKEDAARDTAMAVKMYEQGLAFLRVSGQDYEQMGEVCRDLSMIRNNPADAIRDRKMSLMYFEKAIAYFKNSNAPAKPEWLLERMEERAETIRGLLAKR